LKIFLFLSLLLGSHAWAGWSVSSYNIRNFDNDPTAGQTNINELGKIIQTFKSDVMTFIEVVNLPAFKSVISSNLPDYEIRSSICGGFGKQKLAIIFDTKVFKFIEQTEDVTFSSSTNTCGSLRPVLLVTLERKADKKTFVFAGVHLKAGGAETAMQQRWTQYSLLAKLAKQYTSKNFIMMGDFNTTGYNLRDEDYDHFAANLKAASLQTMSENLACTAYWEGTLENGQHQS
jgi:endonuclease/exonuclease/phosphatase family metal-dependent hydrolase